MIMTSVMEFNIEFVRVLLLLHQEKKKKEEGQAVLLFLYSLWFIKDEKEKQLLH